MRCRWSLLPLLALGLGTSGCNMQNSGEKQAVELPAWLTEDDHKSAPLMGAPAPIADPAPASLALNLKVGDQFPLNKIVDQELVQNTLSGTPRQSRSRLDLTFAIVVQERRDDSIKLAVRYDRVKYIHDVADEHVEFDSTQPAGPIPPAMQAYRDMVNDGFAFWIGADNQIVQVEGLSEFVDRCLRNVPTALRQDVMLGIEAGSGDSGFANFVDNTIGLLPYGRRTSPGDAWERQQQIARPVPMHCSNTYTLKELTDGLAVIDIRGTITPSTTVSAVDSGNGVRVIVNGGSTLGSCTIFRDTGLPKESRVDRTVDMTVVMSNAVQFRQTKRVTTTIQSFPATSAAPLMIGYGSPAGAPSSPAPSSPVTPAAYQQLAR